jgi:hypothetical protein
MVNKTKLDLPAQLPEAVVRPLYAGVGATDRVVAVLRAALADAQKRAQTVRQDVAKTVSGIDYQPKALRDEATKVFSARVDAFGKDAQARRRLVEELVTGLQTDAQNLPARLQKLVDDQLAGAGVTYTEFVRRGETVVGRVRRQPSTREAAEAAKTTTAKAKTTRTQATKAAKKTTSSAKKTARKSPAKSSAKATATSAKKAATSAVEATTDAAAKLGDSPE